MSLREIRLNGLNPSAPEPSASDVAESRYVRRCSTPPSAVTSVESRLNGLNVVSALDPPPARSPNRELDTRRRCRTPPTRSSNRELDKVSSCGFRLNGLNPSGPGKPRRRTASSRQGVLRWSSFKRFNPSRPGSLVVEPRALDQSAAGLRQRGRRTARSSNRELDTSAAAGLRRRGRQAELRQRGRRTASSTRCPPVDSLKRFKPVSAPGSLVVEPRALDKVSSRGVRLNGLNPSRPGKPRRRTASSIRAPLPDSANEVEPRGRRTASSIRAPLPDSADEVVKLDSANEVVEPRARCERRCRTPPTRSSNRELDTSAAAGLRQRGRRTASAIRAPLPDSTNEVVETASSRRAPLPDSANEVVEPRARDGRRCRPLASAATWIPFKRFKPDLRGHPVWDSSFVASLTTGRTRACRRLVPDAYSDAHSATPVPRRLFAHQRGAPFAPSIDYALASVSTRRAPEIRRRIGLRRVRRRSRRYRASARRRCRRRCRSGRRAARGLRSETSPPTGRSGG